VKKARRTYTYLNPGNAFSYSSFSPFNISPSLAFSASPPPPSFLLAASILACSMRLNSLSTFFSPSLGCAAKMLSSHSVSDVLVDSAKSVSCRPMAMMRSSYVVNCSTEVGLVRGRDRVWRGTDGSKSRSKTLARASAGRDGKDVMSGREGIVGDVCFEGVWYVKQWIVCFTLCISARRKSRSLRYR
jgi:hypothetical protein